jgi:copper transport protein
MSTQVGKRFLARVLVAITSLSGSVAWLADTAHAQHTHGSRQTLDSLEILTGLARSVTLWSSVFLAGLVAFTILVWLPVSRRYDDASAPGYEETGAGLLMVRLAWVLFSFLVLAGLIELSLYAVTGSGERFSPALLWEAISGTRVGTIWIARWVFAFATAVVLGWALREGKRSYTWISLGLGCVMLMTVTQLSHAAAESRFLPFVADWLHVIAASVWMGGLLGFSALLMGPLRTLPAEGRTRLLGKAVPRFSGVAAVAVTILLASGIYASFLHLPSFSALIGTAYGRALLMKLGLVVLMLGVGAVNLMVRGRKPFGRMVGAELVLAFAVFVATGFLTTITPP